MKTNYGAFNLRHLSKGLKYMSNITPDNLGITTNQVKVLKNWLKLTGLSNGKELSALGNIIKKHDRFLEDEITMQILHYQIYKNDDTCIWKYVFKDNDFSKEVLIKDLAAKYDFKTDLIVADLNTLLNMYMPRIAEKENSNKAILPLIRKQGNLYYRKEYKPNIWIILAIIIDNLPEPTLENSASRLDLKDIYFKLRNLFNLEYKTMEDILYRLQYFSQIKLKERDIEVLTDYTFLNCIEEAYVRSEANG